MVRGELEGEVRFSEGVIKLMLRTGFTLAESRCGLDIGEKFFPVLLNPEETA